MNRGQRREKIIQDNELRFFFVFFDWAESPSVEMLCTLEKICRLMRAGSCHAERERNNAEAKLMAIKLARDSSQVNEARLPFAIRLVVVLFLLLEILTLEN